MTSDDFWLRPLSIYSGFNDNAPSTITMDDNEDLPRMLTSHGDPGCDAATCKGRDCPAKRAHPCWSPVEFAPGSRRANSGVVAINYAVFDLDHLTAGQIEQVRDTLEDFEYAIHSTHSHAPPNDCCYRLIMTLDQPLTPAQWPNVRTAIVRKFSLPADEVCSDVARLYALPASRAGIKPYAAYNMGASIEVAKFMASSALPAAPRDSRPAPNTNGAAQAEALRTRLADVVAAKLRAGDREHADILTRIIRGDALAESGARDATLLKACGLLGYWLPPDTEWDTVAWLVSPSIAAMQCAPEGFDHWIGIAKEKFTRQITARREDDARLERERGAIVALARRPSLPVETKSEEDDWYSQLIWKTREKLAPCEHNAVLFLEHHEDVAGKIVFNEVRNRIEVTGGALKGESPTTLDVAVAAWLQHKCELMVGTGIATSALARVARRHSYDPIRDYLGELQWDGVSRIDRLLIDYFGVIDNPFARAVSKRWILSMVARAMRPGCEVQTVLILEGAQGAGKTRALRALAGEYYHGTSLSLGDKDFKQEIASAWLIELGELASIRRADTEKVKQFIDQKSDKFRPPYGRVVEEFLRRCVFVGTTNEEAYLTDITGNRRYLCVRVGSEVDVEGIERDRDQIFAEAVTMYRSGERVWLSSEEAALAEQQAEARLETGAYDDAISRWFYAEHPSKRPTRVTLLDVAELALMMPVERVDRGIQTRIGVAMKRLGFVRDREATSGYYYMATQEMLNAPERPRRGLVVAR